MLLCWQVESLLLSEPDNEEYADIHNSLTEVRGGSAGWSQLVQKFCLDEHGTDLQGPLQVIQLTESLLSEALKNAQAAGRKSPSELRCGPCRATLP